MADEVEFDNLSFAEIKKLKVAELKARLASLGLPVSGLKADLVARLASFLESRALQEALTATHDGKESVKELRDDTSHQAKVVLLDSDGDEEQVAQPDVSHTPVLADVSPVITQTTANITSKEVKMPQAIDETSRPSVDTVTIVDTIDIHTQKDTSTKTDQMSSEPGQLLEVKENVAVPEEGEPQSEMEKEIEVPKMQEVGVEYAEDRPVEDVESQPVVADVKAESGQSDSAPVVEHPEKPVEEEYVMVEHDEIPEDIGTAGSLDVEANFSQMKEEVKPLAVDQSNQMREETFADTAQQLIPAAASQEEAKPEEKVSPDVEMETETTEGKTQEDVHQSGIIHEQLVSAKIQESSEGKNVISSDELSQEQFKSPRETPLFDSKHIPFLHPSPPRPVVPPHPQPMSQNTSAQDQYPSQQMPSSSTHQILPQPTLSLPTQKPPQALHDPLPQIILPNVPQEHAQLDKTPPRSSPPKDAPQSNEEASSEKLLQRDVPQVPRDSSPKVVESVQDPEPVIETVPPPMDSLSEAKMKARSLLEMRERRLNEGGSRGDDSGYDVDHYEQEGIPAAASRQEKKKKKKKRKKKSRNEEANVQSEATLDDEGIEVEYVPETLDVRDPVYAQFASIFETFKLSDKPETAKKGDAKDKTEDKNVAEDGKKDDDEMDTDSEEEETQKKEEQASDKVEKLSKKKLKLKNRMSVAELKQTVHRPDVVEMHDVTAPDPKLLVYLKACRNTVPVPRHWCFKRKFLQGKRGIIKPPFQLPDFIQKTGIMEMREALQEKEDAKNMKAKMREKIRPKMGKIDIDYQKLHDAFFKWQTKPKMSIHGDLYYEGKEFETKLKQKKPGDLSEDLRTALGMPTGQGSNLVPPPWLIAMQRYGPPPSYPNLKIRGLNAPIPEGASFGYHAGGWGKPPVDEHGRPLYGDVFGVLQSDMNLDDDEQIDSNLWGELESESEESEESEEESEEEAPDQSGLVTPAETGLVTPSGLTSIPAGMETPDMIELRKRKNIEDAMESGSEQPTLYTVLPEKRAGVGGMMMGTSHVYDLATAAPTGVRKAPGGLSEGVEVALDPSELELDPAAMQARYDEQLREQQNTQKEDFSDMVAEHAARQQKKRKKTTDSGKAAKKYKEFKF